MTATGSAANWRSAGACLSADPDLFFPISSAGPGERQIARAKMICAGCQVRQECLEFALAHDQVYGIWGEPPPRTGSGTVAASGVRQPRLRSGRSRSSRGTAGQA